MAKPGRKPIAVDLDKAESLAARGLTQDQVAESLGMSRSVYYKNKKQMQEFQDAISRGKAKGIAHIANNLFEQSSDGNVAASIFYLKARAGWKEQEAPPAANITIKWEKDG